MDCKDQGLTICPVSWSDAVAAEIRPSTADGNTKKIGDAVAAGNARAWRITGASVNILMVATGYKDGDFLISNIVGSGMRSAWPFIVERARSAGFKRITYDTHNPAVARLYRMIGVESVKVSESYEVAL